MLNIAPECPRCQNDEYYYKPRKRIAGNVIIYERICRQCKQIFYTFEKIDCHKCHSVSSYVQQLKKIDGINLRYRICKVCGTQYKTMEKVIASLNYNKDSMHAFLKCTDNEVSKLIIMLFNL